jgi:hypothetical protein
MGVYHICFFECVVAKVIWSHVSEFMGFEIGVFTCLLLLNGFIRISSIV